MEKVKMFLNKTPPVNTIILLKHYRYNLSVLFKLLLYLTVKSSVHFNCYFIYNERDDLNGYKTEKVHESMSMVIAD